MAEKILQKKAQESNLSVEAKSAGIAAIIGNPASKHAVEVIKEYGMDENHETRGITPEILEWADLILTMTNNHKRILLEQEPDMHHKVYTIKEYAASQSESIEEWDKLKDLYAQLEKKKEEFYFKNKGEIERLQNKYKTLKEELSQIELELNEYQRVLRDLVHEEVQEIERIEQNMPSLDIDDPFGGDLQTYRKTARDIEEAIDKILKTHLFRKK